MTKIDIFSGFLGAGKTTLIKKLIKEAYGGEKLVLIENEFGEIGVDGGFLKEAGIQITEMNSGCICCSLVGDFGRALKKVLEEYHPDRILIEPSGVGKLSDVIRAVEKVDTEAALLNSFTTVVDAGKCRMYMKNFGEFFSDQIAHAGTVILSHTGKLSEEKIAAAVALVREYNPSCAVITTDWDALDGKQILSAIEKTDTLAGELARLKAEAAEEEHHHHHHDEEEHCHEEHAHHHHHDEDEDEDECDDPDCSCHHHDDEDDHAHHHRHHDEDEDEDECDDPDCSCHHHHGHHHADEVFTSCGAETTKKFSAEELENILEELGEDSVRYGLVLRAKGIVEGKNGEWLHFDYVPGEPDVRTGTAEVIGRLCVIGSGIRTDKLSELFGVTLKD